jgi:hypothetical protein
VLGRASDGATINFSVVNYCRNSKLKLIARDSQRLANTCNQ